MKGRWAAGIVPRNFAWILKDQLAVSERPGGYAPHHRRVRRHEELLWLRGQGFTRIVSLLGSSHNLHAYEEHQLPATHFPLPMQGDVRPALTECLPALLEWLRDGERILLHHEELGDRTAGVAAGFLCWSGLLPDAPQAITAVEHLLKRQLGSLGRSIVAAAAEIPPPPASHALRVRPAGGAAIRPIAGRGGARDSTGAPGASPASAPGDLPREPDGRARPKTPRPRVAKSSAGPEAPQPPDAPGARRPGRAVTPRHDGPEAPPVPNPASRSTAEVTGAGEGEVAGVKEAAQPSDPSGAAREPETAVAPEAASVPDPPAASSRHRRPDER